VIEAIVKNDRKDYAAVSINFPGPLLRATIFHRARN